jgi:hypothetical protein
MLNLKASCAKFVATGEPQQHKYHNNKHKTHKKNKKKKKKKHANHTGGSSWKICTVQLDLFLHSARKAVNLLV